ncbi:hypothetical protein [Ruminococcus sp. HUN007]|uniref:hypothetical protein n=1 Tax=Ruminococcus sp. HUN007 TaxID=1514668 RepID=UPI0005D13B71|nr:hypothetical protein [Ruminococcus sp. HUN007]
MKYEFLLLKTCDAGEAVLNNIQNILTYETYCAQAQIYRKYLQQNREKAELYYKNFKTFNDKIFNQAIEILDIAINEANTDLAQSAMDMINTMKSTYPDFYKAHNKQLFRRYANG